MQLERHLPHPVYRSATVYTSTESKGRYDVKHGALARAIVEDPEWEGMGYTRMGPTPATGGMLVIVAEGETAKELLPSVENFEALMEVPEEVVTS